MDFTKIPYQRPDLTEYQSLLTKAAKDLQAAPSGEAAAAIARQILPKMNAVMTAWMLASIRHSGDTRDTFYAEEDAFWNDFGPQFDNAERPYLEALVASPYRQALEAIYPRPYFLKAANQLRIQRPEVLALQQEENQLISRYDELIAQAQVEFDGQAYTLAQLQKPMASADRALRASAAGAYWGFFGQHSEQFDQIYDRLVALRTQIAHELGFEDYAQMSYVFMDRFDYTEETVAGYRKAVQNTVVPLVQAQRAKQARRLGLDHLTYYDLPVQFASGNATPQGSPEELVAKANQIYHELAPEAGDFFQHMIDHNLLDLVAKSGKAGGGYAEYLPGIQSPFIFANFNGTSGDVDVLTHEAGHAFQTYLARWIQPGDLVFPTNEAAEIFSMSMEFITYPWMPLFFKDQTEKYQYAHLQAALEFLPYGILVDHFQHEVYTHPEWTPEQRKASWRQLERLYCPDRDYSENPALERGIYWYRQAHIFDVPFYYIDYTIAQVVAFQFWQRFNLEHDDQAWPDYMTMAKAGGSQTLGELLAAGHLASPFAPETLNQTVAAVKAALDRVDDQALDRP